MLLSHLGAAKESTLFTQERGRKEGGPTTLEVLGVCVKQSAPDNLCPSLRTAESPPGHLLGGSQSAHDTWWRCQGWAAFLPKVLGPEGEPLLARGCLGTGCGMLAQGAGREPEVEPSPPAPFPHSVLPRIW